MMVDQRRVEAGKKGGKITWVKRRKREATTAAKIALWDELVKLTGLLAHPAFTTDDQGHIHYYVTRTDIEAARGLQNRVKQVENNEDLACPFCGERGFDLIGLKSHLQKGDCEKFENLERLQRP